MRQPSESSISTEGSTSKNNIHQPDDLRLNSIKERKVNEYKSDMWLK